MSFSNIQKLKSNNKMNQQQQFHQTTVPMNSGLTRYRSAPSSYFTSLLTDNSTSHVGFGPDDHIDFDNLFNKPEIQQNCRSNSQQLLTTPIKSEVEPQNHRVIGSINSNPVENMKVEGGFTGNSTLIRHRSSPAGLFDDIDIENEFGAIMRSLGSSGAGNTNNPEAPFSSANKFKKSRKRPPIPETRSKNMGENSSIDVQLDEDIPGFPINSWDDSSILSDTFLKGLSQNDDKTFSNANTSNDHDQNINEDEKGSTTRLSHHLSLPTNFSELSAIDNFLQDSVPCKVRAKRGFATHPRSIAERVRRTKISDRIRKLQELVPNMEKQTNTSDMLDLAVDYIKDLQTQVQALSDNRAKCSCSARPKS